MPLVLPPPEHSRLQSSTVLLEKLAAVLPKGHTFGIYHLSTPPTKTDALFNAPLGCRPDRTYCESHFLSVTIDVSSVAGIVSEGSLQVIVFALEIFIFTTAYSSTFFVSKADSSGYLHLQRLPKGTPSPIREVCSAFIGYLVEQRRRKNVQSIVTLFARAQSQYLFPRSVENSGKHVLDDRGLVKWWCRVLDPLLGQDQAPEEDWQDIKGYLIIPGLDHYETRAYIPRTPAVARWAVGHPLEKISHYLRELGGVPPRCLIPQYPDDPKSRFRDELDEEAERSEQGAGAWKSVKTLDQFWEMMAFRQECSSGRMTGFIWVVFNPNTTEPAAEDQLSHEKLESTSKTRNVEKKNKALKGRIVSRLPRIKTQQHSYLGSRPQSTAYFFWPPEGRGSSIVEETDYKRTVELLLQLDFSTLEKAVISTSRWIREAGMGCDWRLEVAGQREAEPNLLHGESLQAPASWDTGELQKRKRMSSDVASVDIHREVNALGGDLVRRKKKGNDNMSSANRLASSTNRSATETTDDACGSTVNDLSTGLIRKKPKLI